MISAPILKLHSQLANFLAPKSRWAELAAHTHARATGDWGRWFVTDIGRGGDAYCLENNVLFVVVTRERVEYLMSVTVLPWGETGVATDAELKRVVLELFETPQHASKIIDLDDHSQRRATMLRVARNHQQREPYTTFAMRFPSAKS